jgi:hypothetical protein
MNEIFDLEGHVNKRKRHQQQLSDGKSKQQLTGRAVAPQKSISKATSGQKHKSDDKNSNSDEIFVASKLKTEPFAENNSENISIDATYLNDSLLASVSADDDDNLIAEV